MLGSKINLFNGNWIETVFEGRNKHYGAYQLRKSGSRILLVSLAGGALFFISAIGFPVLSKYLFKDNDAHADTKTLDTKIVMAAIEPIKKPEEIIHKPVVEKKTKSIVEVVKHVPPVVVDKEEVEQEMANIDDFKDKITGSQNVEASDDGELVLDDTHAEIQVDADITESDNQVYFSVEVSPEYPGGMQKFYAYIRDNFKTPKNAKGGTILVTFVVEPDGSLSNINVLKDMGQGTGDQIRKLLEKSKKWHPGVQNGRSVRVAYRLPLLLE